MKIHISISYLLFLLQEHLDAEEHDDPKLSSKIEELYRAKNLGSEIVEIGARLYTLLSSENEVGVCAAAASACCSMEIMLAQLRLRHMWCAVIGSGLCVWEVELLSDFYLFGFCSRDTSRRRHIGFRMTCRSFILKEQQEGSRCVCLARMSLDRSRVAPPPCPLRSTRSLATAPPQAFVASSYVLISLSC